MCYKSTNAFMEIFIEWSASCLIETVETFPKIYPQLQTYENIARQSLQQKRLLIFAILACEIEIQSTSGNKH